MDELKLTEFANKIDRFENGYGNYKKIHFNQKDITSLKETLTELGVTDIIKEWIGEKGYSVEVNYQYSPQRKVVDDLERRYNRLGAWHELRNNGGTQMSDAEKEFFINEDKRMKIERAKAQAEWEKTTRSIPKSR